jgi:DNA-binding transcriptional regulator YhcF (GntR family)
MDLDRNSPIPLYYQLSEALRYRIATGEIRPGERLPSVRDGARQWGVNLHTVRQAYQGLERSGLLRTDPTGTTVRERLPRAEALEGFLQSTIRRARDEFGLRVPDLQRRLSRYAGAGRAGGDMVYVVECSEAQAAELAGQVAAAFQVRAEAWSLERPGEPPEGSVVATYFHYNDVRRRWPERFPLLHFAAIHPATDLAERIEQLHPRAGDILLCERDQRMAADIAADLARMLPTSYTVRSQIVAHPAASLRGAKRNQVVLFSPRMWGRLSPRLRADPRALEVRYVFDRQDIDSIADRLGWRRVLAGRRMAAGQE